MASFVIPSNENINIIPCFLPWSSVTQCKGRALLKFGPIFSLFPTDRKHFFCLHKLIYYDLLLCKQTVDYIGCYRKIRSHFNHYCFAIYGHFIVIKTSKMDLPANNQCNSQQLDVPAQATTALNNIMENHFVGPSREKRPPTQIVAKFL